MKVLVTGAAGFIGMHVAKILLLRGEEVCGVDDLNPYYDPQLKYARLSELERFKNFHFYKGDISDDVFLDEVFNKFKPDRVVNLAAQAGVRYSIKNPKVYVKTNLVGFANILESCRIFEVKHLVYASSSSVYGANTNMPFSTTDNVDHPVSLYAASKKANELMAHSYSHLYGLPTTGLRYFTVYGPWGRPDMSPWLFTSAILDNRVIDVFNYGQMKRDFTYIDDIAKGTVQVLDKIATGDLDYNNNYPNPSCSYAPYKVYNIGNHQPVKLMDFIETIEKKLNKKANKNMMPFQNGDVLATYADIDSLMKDVDFKPSVCLDEGIEHWVEWYKKYMNLS